MSEAKLYEEIGRRVVAQDVLLAEYRNLLALVGQIKAGTVAPHQVEIDFASASWRVTPREEPAPCSTPPAT